MHGRFVRVVLALVAVLAVAYLGTAFMLTRRSTPAAGPEETPLGNAAATSVISNFHHIESHLDKVGWELAAGKAELLRDKATLQGILMRFYTPQKEVISLQGDTGTIDLATNNIVVTGNVRASWNEEYHFFSDEVAWDSKRKLLVSSGPVRIVGPEGEIQGQGLLARPERKKFVVRGGVEVELKGNLEPLAPAPARDAGGVL